MRYIFFGMFTIRKIAETIEAARASALPLEEDLMVTAVRWIVAAVAAVAVAGLAYAEDLSPKNRVELKRADLSVPGGNMEVILSTAEFQPGDFIPRHIHHGEEAVYVIQGATIETPDGKQMELKTGTGLINLRDVPHGGIKVVGNTALKLVGVQVVDKGKPIWDAPPK